MDLLEYQAKELFRQMGIPVLPSQRIDQARDLKGLKIPYPVVLKSQVYSGGRGKAGGIKFVENTIDAVAAAQAIFHLPIMGQYPEVILAEAKYEPDREIYLAVVLDCSSRRPLLLGSPEGGIDIEKVFGAMQQVLVDQEFTPFYARQLTIKMGLRGELVQTVSAIVEKMYRLFLQKDLDLVEINPLAINPSGEVMALDGKLTANDNALGRHSDLMEIHAQPLRTIASDYASNGLHVLHPTGSIGILCNGAGLTMATLDLVHQAGGKPAAFLNLGGECSHVLPPETLPDRLEQGLREFDQMRGVKVVLINLLTYLVSCDRIAQAVAHVIQRRTQQGVSIVVRLGSQGEEMEAAKTTLGELGASIYESLDEAIAQTIVFSKGKDRR